MGCREHAERFLSAFSEGAFAALPECFAPGGTYRDPVSRVAQAAEALPALGARFAAAFSEARLDVELDAVRADLCLAQWALAVTHTGPLGAGIEATEARALLRGVTTFEGGADGLTRVESYFDVARFVEALGLMALVQPRHQGVANYGYSMRVPGPSRAAPGTIALTWIEGADEDEKARIRTHSRENVRDFLAEPGFVSMVTGFTGLRGFTVTAWEDEAAMRRALSKHHATAMAELFGEDFVASVWTSVWTPTRMNRLWLRCPSCRSLEDVSEGPDACGACGASLPERPAYW